MNRRTKWCQHNEMNNYKSSHLILELVPAILHSSPPPPRPLTSPSLRLKVGILFPRCFYNFVASAYPKSIGHWILSDIQIQIFEQIDLCSQVIQEEHCKGKGTKNIFWCAKYKGPLSLKYASLYMFGLRMLQDTAFLVLFKRPGGRGSSPYSKKHILRPLLFFKYFLKLNPLRLFVFFVVSFFMMSKQQFSLSLFCRKIWFSRPKTHISRSLAPPFLGLIVTFIFL